MFTCQYCRATYQKFQTTCSGCGSRLQAPGEAGLFEKELPPALEGIRQICNGYGAKSSIFYTGKAITAKVEMAEKSFEKFPAGEEIFLFCDTTPMGSGIWGFLLSEDGIYWRNDGKTPSTRTHLPWDEFAQRKNQPSRFTLVFGQGDLINLAGIRRYEDREKIFQLFSEIKSFLEQ